MIRTLLLALALAGVLASIAPNAAATHYVNCDISHIGAVNDAYCAPHRLWDCLSMNSYKQWVGCIKGG